MRRYEEVCHVQKLPAPGLVELVEGGKADSPETDSLLKTLFATLESTPDAVVLGCTHYPFAAKAISRVLGGGVTLLDGGQGTARETRRRLAEAGLLEEGEGALVIENSREDPALIDLSWNLLK